MVWSILWKRGRATRNILRDRVTIILLDTVESPSVLKGIADDPGDSSRGEEQAVVHPRVLRPEKVARRPYDGEVGAAAL